MNDSDDSLREPKETTRRTRPMPWPKYRARLDTRRWLFFHKIEWYLSWAAWAMGNLALLELLDQLSAFSVLFAVILYFAGASARTQQKHYQAWQVINTAQGKGGSGGRIEALQELNADHLPLTGVDASGAFLQGVHLQKALLSRCDLHESDLRDSSFTGAVMSFCNLASANFRHADLSGVKLDNANLNNADLHGANLRGAVLTGSTLNNADLGDADMNGVDWKGIADMTQANVWGIRNAPPDFLTYAMAHGAVSTPPDNQQTNPQPQQ